MPPQTQTQPAGSNQQGIKASDGTVLNPLAVNLAKAIRQHESGGDYNAIGDNGESKGAYQFNKDNFQNWAKEYNLNPDDFSPVNQDKVAYTRINDLLEQGRSPSEVAAIWNGAHMENGRYVANKPQYVDQIKNEYAKIVSDQPPQNTRNIPQSNEGTLGKIIDFAFPIIKDVGEDVSGKSSKTALQQIGDLGLSALWFAPGIGEVAGGAIRGAGLAGEIGSRVAGQALGGAALGYGSDVASKLSQGETDSGVLTPGLGTATGGVLGGVLGRLGAKYSQPGILEDIGNSNNSVIAQTKKGAQELADSLSSDKNPGDFLAKKGINLKALIDPETVSYVAKPVAADLRKSSLALNGALTDALARVPGTITATDLEEKLLSQVPKNAPEKSDIIQNEFNLLRKQYGENLTAADINDWKQRAWDLSKFDTAVPSQIRKTYRQIGNLLKTTVEDMAQKGGLTSVKELNQYIGSHLDAADLLDFLHGTKAKGGRLGDMLQKHALAGALGVGGGIFGGGFLGAGLGALAGEYLGGKLAYGLRKLSSAPIKTAILKKMAQEDPAVIQKVLQYAKQTPKGLEALQQQLQEKGINIFEPKEVTAPISPQKIPQSKKGLIAPLLTTAGARGVLPTQQ